MALRNMTFNICMAIEDAYYSAKISVYWGLNLPVAPSISHCQFAAERICCISAASRYFLKYAEDSVYKKRFLQKGVHMMDVFVQGRTLIQARRYLSLIYLTKGLEE